MIGIYIIIGFILFVSFIAFCQYISEKDMEKNAFYNQKWYNDACKKFGDDYYYPPARHSSWITKSGTIIKQSCHFKPVRNSTYYPSCTPLIPWFTEIKVCYGGGIERVIRRVIFRDKK